MTDTQTQAVGHTPGPWRVGAQNDMLYIIAGRSPSLNNDYPFHDADRTPIAPIYDDEVGFDVASANARAMAAAPALLAALEWLVRLEDQESNTGPDLPEYRAARAAIALAKGEPK